MVTLEEMNDPEYRWTHKKEMHEIMTHTSMRRNLGLVVIDYQKLRCDVDAAIKENPSKQFNWERLKNIVECATSSSIHRGSKAGLDPAARYHFQNRDKGKCFICGRVCKYSSGKSQLHHIIPDGDVSEDNIVTLCITCHQAVHILLYSTGRWAYRLPGKL